MPASPRLILLASVMALAAALTCGVLPTRAIIVYNSSTSMPVGFYLRRNDRIQRGAIVTVYARDVAPLEAHARHFDGPRDRFIKRVAALGGDLVCTDGDWLRVNGRLAALRRGTSADGIPLRRWNGCRRLRRNEALLLGETATSFDGRYWGPVDVSRIEGVWRRL